jgi:hypothetical protein
MDIDFNVESWKVQYLFQAGKLNEIMDELTKYRRHRTALQEIGGQKVSG